MRSVWAGSQLCLSANVFLMRILLMSSWTELCVCQCLSSELSRCLPLSVSQCLSPNLSKEPLDVFLDQPNVCLMGLIGVLTELALTCLSASIYGENPADVCLDWIHLFSCQCLWGWIQSMSAKSFSDVFCQICLLFCQVLFRRNLLMSAWTELACLQYLSGELNQCLLEVSPTACLSVSSSGSLGFLLRRASRRFSCLLPSVSKQSYPQELRSFCHSVSLSVWVFPLFLMELVSNLL